MFIATNTVKVPMFIPSNANFAQVTVYEREDSTNLELLLLTKSFTKRESIINMALVAELKPVTLKKTVEKIHQITQDEWSKNHGKYEYWNSENGTARLLQSEAEVLETYQVFEVTPLHGDINLRVRYITFDKAA